MFKNIDNFAENILDHPYNTRSGIYYVPEFQDLTLTRNQSIKFQAPSNWNNIPDNVKNSPSVHSFKRNYKRWLLSFYNE